MPSHGLLYFTFLAIIWIGHWPLRNFAMARCLWLFVASVAFYATWNVQYLIFLVFVTVLSFCGGLVIDQARRGFGGERFLRSKQVSRVSVAVLIVPAVACLIPLIVFKYGRFLQEALVLALLPFSDANQSIVDPEQNWVLRPLEGGDFEGSIGREHMLVPIGISFYTFQAIGYLIDVYRRHFSAERNLLRHAAFLAFFPQLVAGPIEQARKLSPQLWKKVKFKKEDFTTGFHLIGIGLFKKIVLADNAAQVVESTLAQPDSAIGVYCGAFAFMGQLYFDIAAYTDIARGSARLLGVELSPNLRAPFLQKTCSGFWASWHISVTQWFRSYVYWPLVTQPKRRLSQGTILVMTMVATGLWHGASWNFVLFGGLHGIWIWIEVRAKRLRFGNKVGIVRSRRWLHALQWLGFIHLLSWSGTLFFAEDLRHQWQLLCTLFEGNWSLSLLSYSNLITTIALWWAALWYQRYESSSDCPLPILRWPKPLRVLAYCLALFLFIFVGNFSSQDFVYMRF